MKKRRRRKGSEPEHVVRKDEDLRIPNATPEELARAVLSGGAAPRPETRPANGPKP